MRLTRLGSIALVVALLVRAQSVVATEAAGETQGGSIIVPQSQPPSRANPYRRLFTTPDINATTPPGASALSTETREPRVVCGMTLIPANPNVDPKMAIEPKQRDTRYTIRAVEPPICK